MHEYLYIRDKLAGLIEKDEILLSVLFLLAVMAVLTLPWLLLSIAHAVNRTRYFVLSLPVMRSDEVYTGSTFLKGKAESPEPLVSYLTGTSCVWYAYHVQEQWKRTIKTPYTDSKGRKRIKRETVYGWSPLYADEDSQPFHLRDQYGSILVNPEGAQTEPLTVLSCECGVDDPLYFAKGPEGCVPGSTYRRRFVEQVIPVNQTVNILGEARESDDNILPEIALGANKSVFMISTHRKRDFISRTTWQVWSCQATGLIIAALPLALFTAVSVKHLEPFTRLPLSSLLVTAYVFWGVFQWRRLSLESMRQIRKRAYQAWKQLEAQLQEKQVLIPELYKIASYYCGFDAMSDHVRGILCRKLERGEVTFDMLADEYPELSKGKIFLPLKRKLANTEERIKLSARAYDAYVRHYNRVISRFPGRLINRLYRLRPLSPSSQIDRERYRPVIIHETTDIAAR